jgi:hypothetical protein
MVKIAFWDNSLCERGTTVAVFDYAFFNKTLLGNESVIFYNKTREDNCEEVISKFKKEFNVYCVNDFSEVDKILLETGCDMIYIIKHGNNDGKVSKVVKTCVHCVFAAEQPHGDVYAVINHCVQKHSNSHLFVPHLINLPENEKDMREELNIPKEATVFGRHGGFDTFNISFVHPIVYDIAKNNPNIYFLFLNTKTFCENLPNIIHLPKVIDLNKKVEFINTCDAMLWAREDGEVFSLSMGEFSVKNKPIFTTLQDVSLDERLHGHKYMLGDKAIWYTSSTLHSQLLDFHSHKYEYSQKDWNAYSEYTPEKVMDIFKKVFIDA